MCRELPVYLGALVVPAEFPCGSFGGHPFERRNPVCQALPLEAAQLDLGDVEPAPVLGRVMNFQPVRETAR